MLEDHPATVECGVLVHDRLAAGQDALLHRTIGVEELHDAVLAAEADAFVDVPELEGFYLTAGQPGGNDISDFRTGESARPAAHGELVTPGAAHGRCVSDHV